jgi:hypothetical protein
VATFLAAICPYALAQDAPAAGGQSTDVRGLPPRATPGDYQAHAQAGAVTIGAEFTGHSVTTPQAIFLTEDYVVVEVGLFAPGTNLKLSYSDFSLRINGKKQAQPAGPYGLVFQSLKDPEWVPPGGTEPKSKGGGLSTGGGGGKSDDPPPLPPKMPIELVRVMQQRVQKASLAEGDRPLPQAGLIYFQHGGKVAGIHSLELIYNGPAGKASLELQP